LGSRGYLHRMAVYRLDSSPRLPQDDLLRGIAPVRPRTAAQGKMPAVDLEVARLLGAVEDLVIGDVGRDDDLLALDAVKSRECRQRFPQRRLVRVRGAEFAVLQGVEDGVIFRRDDQVSVRRLGPVVAELTGDLRFYGYQLVSSDQPPRRGRGS